ncbi:hypothetical protein LJC64_05020 [Ruminococcaceae bacterium OttesenSCG-928-A11]|nr:hypothetical protein [Ruminococcaceae bacterium OttesenSCG-928-A11]
MFVFLLALMIGCALGAVVVPVSLLTTGNRVMLKKAVPAIVVMALVALGLFLWLFFFIWM